MLNLENFRVFAVGGFILAALGHTTPTSEQAKTKPVTSIFGSKRITSKSLKKFEK